MEKIIKNINNKVPEIQKIHIIVKKNFASHSASIKNWPKSRMSDTY